MKLTRIAPLSTVCLMLLLSTTGCGHVQRLLGLRTSLAKLPVTTMEATLPKDPAIAPGEKSPLVVTLTDTAGKVWVTEGQGKGKIQWSDITVTPTVVTYKKGVLSLPYDPRISEGKTGHVDITAPSHPTLHAELDIPLRYNYPFQAAYAGPSGSNGFNGTDGSAGSNGSTGSIDADNPSAGGDGGNGGDGTNGTDGGDGGDGPVVQVWVTLKSGPTTLLEAKVTASGHKDRYYLIDPNGGSLTVKSLGGSGGSGGKGGRGGAGGSGGAGIPPGSDGLSGHDGLDGSDGRDGSDGPVTITYDPQVQPYLTALIVPKNSSSSTKFIEQTVAPLW